MTQVQAIAKNIRISPQKVRLVADQIKKISPQGSLSILEHVPQKAAKPLKKLIASAIANANNNNGLETDSLTFKEISVTKGQVFKRFRAVSRGRAHSILRRTSNIRIVLEGSEKKIQKAIEATNATKELDIKNDKKEAINGSKS